MLRRLLRRVLKRVFERLLRRVFGRLLRRVFGRVFGRLSKLMSPPKSQGAARSSDRAFFLWVVTTIAGAALALSESNLLALYAVAVLLPLVPSNVGKAGRFCLAVLAITAHFAGPGVLLVAVPFGLVAAGRPRQAVAVATGLAASAVLYPHFQNVPDVAGRVLHAGSAAFLFVPAWMVAIFGVRDISALRLAALVMLPAVTFLALDAAAVGRWIGASELADPSMRFVLAIIPIVAVVWGCSFRDGTSSRRELIVYWLPPVVIGAAVVLAIRDRDVTEVTFDEAHGKWETIQADFTPDSFGRAANYTYSLLSRYSERLTGEVSMFLREDDALPSQHAIFVVKMPTVPLSPSFANRLEAWVRDGGRLLVIADHTDLYDTAQVPS